MSGIVAIAKDGSVLMGGDSAGTSLKEGEIYNFKNPKVFKAGKHFAVGYTTSYRMGQILQYETAFPEPPADGLERFMATVFVDAVRSSLEAHGFTRGLGEHGSILVGVRGQLFTICSEFQAMSEDTPYTAIGSGRHAAYGALYALEGSGKSPREQAEIALRAAERFTPAVRGPFTFVQV